MDFLLKVYVAWWDFFKYMEKVHCSLVMRLLLLTTFLMSMLCVTIVEGRDNHSLPLPSKYPRFLTDVNLKVFTGNFNYVSFTYKIFIEVSVSFSIENK